MDLKGEDGSLVGCTSLDQEYKTNAPLIRSQVQLFLDSNEQMIGFTSGALHPHPVALSRFRIQIRNVFILLQFMQCVFIPWAVNQMRYLLQPAKHLVLFGPFLPD